MFNKVKAFMTRKSVIATSVVGGTSLLAAVPSFAATTDTGVDLSGVTLPFTIGGMLATSTNFLGMYGQWIVLALGVIFSPVLYGLAVKLVTIAKSKMATNK